MDSMTLAPTRENVHLLSDEKGVRIAVIIGKDIYTLVPCAGEEIAELFAGGVLPMVQNELKSRMEE